MDKIGEFFKYWLWDRWHGESVSRFDERRITNPFGPVLDRIRVPRWVIVALLVIVAGIFLSLLVPRLLAIEFVSQEKLATETGQTGICFANVGGWTYVAVRCLLIVYMPAFVYTLLLVAAFIAGYITHAYVEKRRKEQ